MKILAFGASSSRHSINQRFALYAASLVRDADVTTLSPEDYELPLFSVDLEKAQGAQPKAQAFLDQISAADALIISFAEHNGNFTAAFKNLFDWTSRIEVKLFQNKPTLLLSTSPGGRGGIGALTIAQNSLPHFGADVKGSFSLPRFNDNFDAENNRIADDELRNALEETLQKLR